MAFKLPLLSQTESLPESQHDLSGWRPLYLRRRMLFLFLFVFCGIIGALEALKEHSRLNHGLASSVQSRHYTWTYGPTAIFIIVAAIWARVEFQAKQSAPWLQLREGPEVAEKNVLLDYVSNLQPLALIEAIKNHHWLPAAATSCSLLFRLLIVFSTGLFTLKSIPIPSEGIPAQLLDSLRNNNLKYDNTSYEPFDILNAVIFENLTYPDGTNKDLLFQRFSAPGLSSNAILNITVDGLAADLECEPATVKVNQWEIVTLHQANTTWNKTLLQDIEMSTPSCNISTPFAFLPDQNSWGDIKTAVSYNYGYCNHSSGPDGGRLVLSAAEIHSSEDSAPYDVSNDGPGPVKEKWRIKRSLSLKRSKQLICKPSLSSVTLQAGVNLSEPLSSAWIQRTGHAQPLSDFTNWNLTKSTFLSKPIIALSRPITYEDPFPSTNSSVDISIKLGAYLAKSGVVGDIENLFNEDMLYDSGVSYYRAMTAQIMRVGMVDQHQSTTVGSAIMDRERVVMTSLSLRVVEVCLALLLLLVIGMIALLSRKSIAGLALAPWDPNKISTIAALLPTSTGFWDSVRDAGAASSDIIHTRLARQRYQSISTAKGFSIAITDGDCNGDRDLKDNYIPWKPFPNLCARIIVFIMVASVIVALEVVLHVSQKNDGLGNVSTDDNLHYLWTVLPAMAMVSIGLFFGTLDFNTRSLAPYARLRKPNGELYSNSMSLDFLDFLGISTIIRAIRKRELAVFATTLATMVSAFLTITSSGLYSVFDVPTHISMDFTQKTVFYNSSRPNRTAPERPGWSRQSEGVVTSDFILRDNVSFPHWTYDTLAFPRLAIAQNNSRNSFVDMKIPALRSRLTCELLTGSTLNTNYTRKTIHNSGEVSYVYSVTVDLPEGLACGDNKNTSSETLGATSRPAVKPHNYIGEAVELGCLKDNYSRQANSYVWGYLNNATDDVPFDNMASLACTDQPEFVDTAVRFKLPSMDIDEDHPPVPDESTARLNDMVYIPFMDQTDLPGEVDDVVDTWFKSLVSGRYAIPIEDLGDPNQNEKVAAALKHQHMLIRAQQYSSYVRLEANGSMDHEPLLGNVTQSGRLRLVQDPVSTRVLEALLAFMLVLGILGSMCLNTDRVLPKNPCSIAAVASLLADSNFLDRFDAQMGDPSDKSVGNVSFAGCRFHLGYRDAEAMNESVQIKEGGVETKETGAEKFSIYLSDPAGNEDGRWI